MKVEAEINEGLSFALGCSFRKTKYKNIHITNYDFINKKDLREKGLSILVYRDCGFVNTKFISNSVFRDKTKLNLLLDSFKNECINIKQKL